MFSGYFILKRKIRTSYDLMKQQNIPFLKDPICEDWEQHLLLPSFVYLQSTTKFQPGDGVQDYQACFPQSLWMFPLYSSTGSPFIDH